MPPLRTATGHAPGRWGCRWYVFGWLVGCGEGGGEGEWGNGAGDVEGGEPFRCILGVHFNQGSTPLMHAV